VNYRIDAFNSKMGKVISNEFKALRERVLKVVDDAFKESEKYIREYMVRKEQQLTNELAQMRTLLEKEAARVEEMKEELSKPQWRKVAGEILSTDFEKRVEEIVKKSEGLEAGQWELGDIAGYRIKNIENELKEIIRLKT
jgi:cell shape-determining protein MreC